MTGYTPYPALENDTRLPHIRDKLAKQIEKTALGATTSVPYEYHDNLLSWLDSSTLPLIALEQAPNSTNISSFIPPDEFVLILGEEVEGISAELLEQCDTIVEIPMHGAKESFNVSVAAGIALFALSHS